MFLKFWLVHNLCSIVISFFLKIDPLKCWCWYSKWIQIKWLWYYYVWFEANLMYYSIFVWFITLWLWNLFWSRCYFGIWTMFIIKYHYYEPNFVLRWLNILIVVFTVNELCVIYIYIDQTENMSWIAINRFESVRFKNFKIPIQSPLPLSQQWSTSRFG